MTFIQSPNKREDVHVKIRRKHFLKKGKKNMESDPHVGRSLVL